jgi:hypothetical protein
MGTFATVIRRLTASLCRKSPLYSETKSTSVQVTPQAFQRISPALTTHVPDRRLAYSTQPNSGCLSSIACTQNASPAQLMRPDPAEVHEKVAATATPATNTPQISKIVQDSSRRTPCLRVVQHISLAQAGPAHTAVRLTMSGTLADICAELDRLTQLEQSTAYLDIKSLRGSSRRASSSLAAA